MYSSILVPLDGSRIAAEAVPYGAAFARNFGASLTLLRAIAPSSGILVESEMALRELESRRSQAEGYLMSLRSSLSMIGVRAEIWTEEGEMVEAVLGAVSRLVRPLIVVSGQGATASSNPMAMNAPAPADLGSIAEQVLRRWQGPILLVGQKSTRE